MIAKAKAITHGINAIRYLCGESRNKRHPEMISRVLDNRLPPELDAAGIWNSMQLTLSQHRPIKNSVIRIELSPSPKHTRFYRMEDWQELWHDFAEEFDKQVIKNRDGTVRSCPTHLAESKYTVWLHQESASGILHLHAAVCRMDEEGYINNDHRIHLRAQRAAEQAETRLDTGRRGTKHPRSTGEPRLHGDFAGDAFLVMGRVSRSACPEGLFRSRKAGQQRGAPGLLAPQGRG